MSDVLYTYVRDDVWVHFGDARSDWEGRCAECWASAHHRRRLPPAALQCWKVEIWYSAWPAGAALDRALLSWAGCDRALTGKYSLAPMPVVASDPRQSYPAGTSRVALLYCWGRDEFNAVSGRAPARLEVCGAGSGPLHHRRGCWVYDDFFGPWTTWPTGR